MSLEKVVLIVGPTAVGKTKLSLEIARRFDTEIINGDAMQVYRGMNIGTAKVKPHERIVPHHLIDIVDSWENYSVYNFQQQARQVIDRLITEKKLPLLVGGTGLYLDSTIYNYCFTDELVDHGFQEYLSNLSNDQLYDLYLAGNPDSKTLIHPNNRKRVERAVMLQHMKQDSTERSKNHQKIYQPLFLWLTDERDSLYERINQRVDAMMEEGLLDEVKSFFPDQLSQTAKSSIGYRELFSYLRGDCSLPESLEAIKLATRRLAKRQLTWFRNHPDVVELSINASNFNETIDKAEIIIKSFLNQK